MDSFDPAPSERRFPRQRFVRLAAGGVAALAVTPLFDWDRLARAAPAVAGDDWASQKELVTTADEFGTWVDGVVKALQEYKTKLENALKDNPEQPQLRETLGKVITALDTSNGLPALKDLARTNLELAKVGADGLLAPIALIRLVNTLGAAGLTLYLSLLGLILARVVAALGGGEGLSIPWEAMDKALEFVRKGFLAGGDKDSAKRVEEIEKLKEKAKELIEKAKDATEALKALQQALKKLLGKKS